MVKKFIFKLNNIKKYWYLLLFNLIYEINNLNQEKIINALIIKNHNIKLLFLLKNYFQYSKKKTKAHKTTFNKI